MIETFGPSSPDGLLLASIFCLTVLAITLPPLHFIRAQLLTLCSGLGSLVIPQQLRLCATLF
jgi:hypothetical protein